MKTIAIDDEPLALQLTGSYIRQTPFLEMKGLFDNPLSALAYCSAEPVDLILLDIRMPELSGIDFAKTLHGLEKIIFTTAYDQYALEGFRLQAVDYLLKPFSYEEFLTAANKAFRLFDLERRATSFEADQTFLFIKADYKIRRIRFDDILFIEGLKDYIRIFLKHTDRPVMSLSTLKAIENRLPSTRFMRVHRSYIVNLTQVDLIERSQIVFGDKVIPVSEQYKEAFQEFLKNNFL